MAVVWTENAFKEENMLNFLTSPLDLRTLPIFLIKSSLFDVHQ